MATILIIDDDRDIQLVARMALQAAGHEVLLASGGEEGLQMIRSKPPDLVILDVMMPVTSGWDVLAEIRGDSRTKLLPVMMISALGDTSSKVKGLRAGADDYMTKPFDPAELLARVEALLLRRVGMSAGLQGRLEEHSLPEIAQSLEQSSKSGRLIVEGLEQRAEAIFREGRVLMARLGPLEDADALLAMLDLREGEFRFENQASSGASSEEGLQLSSILMEGVWLTDELSQRSAHLPPEDARLGIAEKGRELRIPHELSQLPFEEILEALRSSEPMSLVDLLEALPRAPKRIRFAIAWLCQEGFLVPVLERVPASEREEAVDRPPEEGASALLDRAIATQARSGRDSQSGGILFFHSDDEECSTGLAQEFAELAGVGLERILDASGVRLALHGTESSLHIHCRQMDDVAEAGDADWLAVILCLADPELSHRRLAALLSTVEWTVASGSRLFLILPENASAALRGAIRRSDARWQVESSSTITLAGIIEGILEDAGMGEAPSEQG